MVQMAEVETAPETAIEATLNYIQDNGEKLFTYTGGPGSLDVRTGGSPDPRQVVIRNGRDRDFALDRDGFRFVRHDTKVGDFFDEEEVRGLYYREMVELVKQESGAVRVVVFDHTLRTADDELRETRKIAVVRRVHNDYTEWSGPQRARHPARRSGRPVAPPLRHHPGVAADPAPGRELSARDLRRAACRRMISSSPSGAIPTGSARPTPSPTIPITRGTGSRACGATRRWCSRSMTRSRTAAPAGPRTPRSRTRPRRPTHGRARASRSARWHFLKTA